MDEDGQGCGGRLFRANFVVWELIGTEFAGGQVKFEDLGECCDQVGLLLQAGQVAMRSSAYAIACAVGSR